MPRRRGTMFVNGAAPDIEANEVFPMEPISSGAASPATTMTTVGTTTGGNVTPQRQRLPSFDEEPQVPNIAIFDERVADDRRRVTRRVDDTVEIQEPLPPPEHRILVDRRQHVVQWRDFNAEVRGWLDVDHLLAECEILLDVDEVDLRNIVRRMVDAMQRSVTLSLDSDSDVLPFGAGAAANTPPRVAPAAAMNTGISFAEIESQLFTTPTTASPFQVTNIERRLQTLICTADAVYEDQSWFILYCSIASLNVRPKGGTRSDARLAFTRLRTPTNFGGGVADTELIALIVAPIHQKVSKSALETARTFGTLLADVALRQRLLAARTASDFKRAIEWHVDTLATTAAAVAAANPLHDDVAKRHRWCPMVPCAAIIADFRRRFACYASDFTDGLCDGRACQKTLSAAAFVYFAVLPTAIALGMMNESNTRGQIGVQKVMLSQWIGGLLFGLIGGQPLLIMLTSPPIIIYTQVIQEISIQSGENFFQLYSAIGLWCSLFLALFAVFEVPAIMKYSRRSLEDLFGLFISSALIFKASCSVWEAFSLYDPTSPDCKHLQNGQTPLTPLLLNETEGLNGPPALSPHLHAQVQVEELVLRCGQAVGVTHLVLLLGTVWLAISIDAFRRTPYLARQVREIFADHALPIAVLAMALLAHTVFAHIPQRYFTLRNIDEIFPSQPPPLELPIFALHLPPSSSTPSPLLPPPLPPPPPEDDREFWELSARMQALCCLLGLPLAVFFTMDQLIVTKTMNNRRNNLRKGSTYYWDLLMAALINCLCSALALPWMHVALPQSYLHLRALADVEDRFTDGTLQQVIVKNRETRCATLLAHLAMIPTYFWLIPTIRLIPTSVFHGLFVYLAVSSARGNELCQRVALLFTEQRAYPPYHYVRRVPQHLIHAFTGVEVVQWAVLFGIGFAPWPLVQLAFPLIIFLFIPFRSLLLPRLLDAKYLEAIDGVH